IINHFNHVAVKKAKQRLETKTEPNHRGEESPALNQISRVARKTERGTQTLAPPRGNRRQRAPPRGNQRQRAPPRGNQRQRAPPRGNQRQRAPPRGNQRQRAPPRGNQRQRAPPRGNQGSPTESELPPGPALGGRRLIGSLLMSVCFCVMANKVKVSDGTNLVQML
uniref:Uncharacterized protein n=1 Tax=Takifugu rubripes TaxID=31033 RepID=A0A674P0T3_TAKRU